MGQNVSKDFVSLVEASAEGDMEKLQAAIEAGADVNGQVELEGEGKWRRIKGYTVMAGETPLHVALRTSGSIDCVRLLIHAGADVNIANRVGANPLYFAVRRKNTECVKLLIEAGADVNSEVVITSGTRRSTTVPLNIAIGNANGECVKVLLDAGADVKRLSLEPTGSWFMRHLAQDKKIRCLQILLSRGFAVNSVGNFWGSALQSFLSFLGENKSAMKGVKLIMAAGENGGRLVQVKASGHSLKAECRETIRRHLLSINNINLFVRVPQLPLPAALKSYLLYDVTLDEDYVTNDVTDDVEFICVFLSPFEAEASSD